MREDIALAHPDHDNIPGPHSYDLGHALSSVSVGTETLREPLRLTPFEHWVGHIPFAFWLISALRPRVLVELGTHRGNSYLAFCQAIEAEECGTRAYAVDTWEGDTHMAREAGIFEELSAYHDPKYGHFSSLIRSTFQEARELFSDGSIDLLHIDGTHTYEAVKQDFDCWQSALSDRAVVLFHDVNVRRSQYGVWRLWEELSKDKPHFEFFHSYGLGVLGMGSDLPRPLKHLFALHEEGTETLNLRSYFAARGAASVERLAADVRDQTHRQETAGLKDKVASLNENLLREENEVERLCEEIAERRAHVGQLLAEINGRDAHVAHLEGYIGSQRAEAADKTAKIEELNHLIASLRDALFRAETDFVNLKVQKDSVDEQLRDVHDSHKTIRQSLDAQDYRLRGLLDLARRVLLAKDEQLNRATMMHERGLTELEHHNLMTGVLRDIIKTKQRHLENAVSIVNSQSSLIGVWKGSSEKCVSNFPDNKPIFMQHEIDNLSRSRSFRFLKRLFNTLGRSERTSIALSSTLVSDSSDREADDIRSSGFFDEHYYLEQNPDVANSGEDPAVHFAREGWKEGRQPNWWFDPLYYLMQYAEVEESGHNPLIHFAEFGIYEGRNTLAPPSFLTSEEKKDPESIDLTDEQCSIVEQVRLSGLFDEEYYRKSNPDVARAGINPLIHFSLAGWREGRKPNEFFDVAFYLSQYPDVVALNLNPVIHFAQHGFAEGRTTLASGNPVLQDSYAMRRKLLGIEMLQTQIDSDIKSIEATNRWPIEMPDLFHLRDFKAAHRICVVAHVYYPELWSELKDAIVRIPESIDIFVTLVDGKSDHLAKSIRQTFPTAEVLVFPNRGRDILSFLTLASAGVLTQYDLICKIHTKRSPHRSDGDAWRRNLITNILPSRSKISNIVSVFDADPDLGIVVADGEIFSQDAAWLQNLETLAKFAPMMGRSVSEIVKLPFAGGSMFWMRPFILYDIIGLKIEPEQYEPEPIGTDGTIAHAIERLFSTACYSAGMHIAQSSEVETRAQKISRPLSTHDVTDVNDDLPPSRPRVVAFYLPQYHPIAENNRWWGKGFTEWTNVTKAQPLFAHHRQPRLPGELGFTDLRVPEVRSQQAELAREYGISAFCYYYYWFGDNKRLLERPLFEVLRSQEPNFPFMICWANEPWSRNWDGANREVLVAQDYEDGWVDAFAREIAPILKDSRYLRLEGPDQLPIIAIYRIMHIPSPSVSLMALRDALRRLGVGDVHLTAGWLNFSDDERLPERAQLLGLDSYFEFPPHHLHLSIPNVPDRTALVPKEAMPDGLKGQLYNYSAVVDLELEEGAKDTAQTERHRGVMMGWDNTARRGVHANVFRGATPGHFRRWLRGVVQQTASRPAQAGERLIFVNAWNEWAEGTCLEPDRDFGRGWLQAVRLASATTSPTVDSRREMDHGFEGDNE